MRQRSVSISLISATRAAKPGRIACYQLCVLICGALCRNINGMHAINLYIDLVPEEKSIMPAFSVQTVANLQVGCPDC